VLHGISAENDLFFIVTDAGDTLWWIWKHSLIAYTVLVPGYRLGSNTTCCWGFKSKRVQSMHFLLWFRTLLDLKPQLHVVLLPNRYPGTSTVYAMRECFQIHHSISPAAVTMKNESFSALIPCNTFTYVYCETLNFHISDQADSMRFIAVLIRIPCCDELSNCWATMTSGLECYSMT